MPENEKKIITDFNPNEFKVVGNNSTEKPITKFNPSEFKVVAIRK